MNNDESADLSKIDNLRDKIAKEDERMIYRLWLNSAYRRIITGIIILGTIYFGLTFGSDLTQDGIITILFFLLIIYLWVSETFPLPVTALFAGVGLVILGLRTRDEAFAPYASDAVFMILGSLIVAQGITASKADELIIRKVLPPFTKSTYGLLAGIILISCLLAAVIPDHGVAAIMLPILLTIIDKTDIKEKPNECVTFTIALAFACAIAGLATPSGGARNVIAIGFLQQDYGVSISYLDWVFLAAPITIIMIPLLFLSLIAINKLQYRKISFEMETSEEIDREQIKALAILMGTFILFLLTEKTGLTLGTTAMVGAIAMHVTGVLEWEESRSQLRWGVMFIYGAALTLGATMVEHGVAEWIADGIFRMSHGQDEMIITLVIITLAILLTNIMSDGAAAAVLVPITLAVAFSADMDLIFIGMITSIGTAFAFMTSFGTPPNLIVHASGIPTSKDFAKNGIPMVLIAVVVVMFIEQKYWPLGPDYVFSKIQSLLGF